MTAKDAAALVLKKEGGVLHVREITKRIISGGLWKTSGKTPWDTVEARLSEDINRKGKASPFIRTAPGTFGLKEYEIPKGQTPTHAEPKSKPSMSPKKFIQPKPDSMKYSDLIREIEKGTIKIPKFQRDFVWNMEKTAKLLDSILKGYPVGNFTFWETSERMNNERNIGNIKLPDTPEGIKVQYVLDGQQRIASIFAAYMGAKINKAGESKMTDYGEIFVNLNLDAVENEEQIVTAGPTGEKCVSLHDVLNFSFSKGKELSSRFNDKEINTVNEYSKAFNSYDFSIVTLKREDIDSAIEVFTRINTGGQTLTVFEIMSAKTYDEQNGFDLREKWDAFVQELEDAEYETVSSTVALQLLALMLSRTRECTRKSILSLDKRNFIDKWDEATSAMRGAIDHFRTAYKINASRLLPYDSLLVPFSWFFYENGGDPPDWEQAKLLEEFFWRMSLASRYSFATESSIAKDIGRVSTIREGRRPDYTDIKAHFDPQTLIDTSFSVGNSYCKAILCLLAQQGPKDFRSDADVILDNSWLKAANSKNYHHFFPRAYLKGRGVANANSVVNITFVSDRLNKRKIGSRAPSDYIGEFAQKNPDMNRTLDTHMIAMDGFGIREDDYGAFLGARAERMAKELETRAGLSAPEHDRE